MHCLQTLTRGSASGYRSDDFYWVRAIMGEILMAQCTLWCHIEFISHSGRVRVTYRRKKLNDLKQALADSVRANRARIPLRIGILDVAHVFRTFWHSTADLPLSEAYERTMRKPTISATRAMTW